MPREVQIHQAVGVQTQQQAPGPLPAAAIAEPVQLVAETKPDAELEFKLFSSFVNILFGSFLSPFSGKLGAPPFTFLCFSILGFLVTLGFILCCIFTNEADLFVIFHVLRY